MGKIFGKRFVKSDRPAAPAERGGKMTNREIEKWEEEYGETWSDENLCLYYRTEVGVQKKELYNFDQAYDTMNRMLLCTSNGIDAIQWGDTLFSLVEGRIDDGEINYDLSDEYISDHGDRCGEEEREKAKIFK